MNYTLNLISLSCFQSSEDNGDEIYLMFNKKKIWPIKGKFEQLKTNANQKISLELDNIQMNKLIRIELWEHDTFFDDYLGCFEFLIDNCGDSFDTDLKKIKPDSIHKYSLKWEARVNRKKRHLVSSMTGK